MMNDKSMRGIELLAIIIIVFIFCLIIASFVGNEPTKDQELQWCMSTYEDFDYCKYKLGVE